MSLMIDGRRALETMVNAPEVFRSIKPEQWSSTAINLAKKQLIAGKQTRDDILKIRETLSPDVFEKTLDALKPMHLKQLARRVDRTVTIEQIRTGKLALEHIRTVLADSWQVPEPEESEPAPTAETPKSNPYIGRKAFRTGR